MENLNLAQKLHENLEEMKSVMKERDNLRGLEETLRLERDLLKADLQGSTARVSCPPTSCQIPVFILRSFNSDRKDGIFCDNAVTRLLLYMFSLRLEDNHFAGICRRNESFSSRLFWRTTFFVFMLHTT